MSRLTLYLARLIGLFSIIMVAVVLARGSAAVMNAVADPQAMFLYGVISLGLGVAMILGHNVWSGGVLPVVVTLTGWLIFTKGVMLLALTPEALQTMMQRMDYPANAQLYVFPALAIGVYMCWAGFTSDSGGIRNPAVAPADRTAGGCVPCHAAIQDSNWRMRQSEHGGLWREANCST